MSLDDFMEPSCFEEEEVFFTNNGAQVFGILTKPRDKATYPAVVLLHGSERRGVSYQFYVDQAHGLVKSGFAVLRYDSPGVGRSEGSTLGESLEARAEEAVSAVHYLQSREDVVSGLVGLWGHSQGGWVCQKAAAVSGDVAFIVPVSGPGISAEKQEVYRVEAQSRGAGFSGEDVRRAVLVRRLTVDLILEEPRYRLVNVDEARELGNGAWNALTRICYDNEINSELLIEAVIQVFEAVKDEPWARFLFLDQVLGLFKGLDPAQWEHVKVGYSELLVSDPADSLKHIHVPVLAVFGEDDQYLPVQESIEVYEKYLNEAGNEDFSYRIFPGANHSIEVDEEFAPGYFDTIIDWLKELDA